MVGTISETSRSSVQTRLATRSLSPPTRNGERGWSRKSHLGPSPNTGQAGLLSRERRSGNQILFFLLPQIRPKKDRSALFGLCGVGVLSGEPRCLWRREASHQPSPDGRPSPLHVQVWSPDKTTGQPTKPSWAGWEEGRRTAPLNTQEVPETLPRWL